MLSTKRHNIYWANTNFPTCSCCYDEFNYVYWLLTDVKEEHIQSFLRDYIDNLPKDEECDLTAFLAHISNQIDCVFSPNLELLS